MDEISDLALQKILELIPFKDRKICRLVCKQWKKEIDGCEAIGLSVKIDSREQESGILEFLQHVVVKEADIFALVSNPMEETRLNLNLDYTKTLALSGYTDPFFISSRILRTGCFDGLTKLYFCGSFLIGQELTQPDDVQPLITCCFPVLRELYLALDGEKLSEVEHYIWELPRFLVPRFSGVHSSNVHVRLSDRVHRNAAYLLSVIHSHRLKIMEIMLDTVCFWNLEPLYKFIEDQGHHLIQLVVSPQLEYEPFMGNPPMQFPDAGQKFSPANSLRNLRSIYLHNMHPTQLFWKDLVDAQERLEEIHLHFIMFPKKRFSDFITTLVTQNHETMKCLIIKADASGPRTEGLEVDMKLFCVADRLEVLKISTRGRNKKAYPSVPWRSQVPRGRRPTYYPQYPTNFRMKNINHLPRSLKVFTTSFVTGEGFDGVTFLRNMIDIEEVKLTCIQRAGFMKERLQVSEFFKTALRHRQLDRFDIEFMLPEPIPLDIGGSWHNIRPLHFGSLKGGYHGYIRTEIDNINELLYGEFLVEKFFLGDSLGCDRIYIRNYFEAIELGSVSPDLPFHRNPRVSYVKIPSNFVYKEESAKKYGGKPPLSFSDCSWPPDYHSVLNLTIDLQKNMWMSTKFLVNSASWPGPEPSDWKKGPYDPPRELEADTDGEDDESDEEEDNQPIVHNPGSELPEFLISRPITKMETYFSYSDPEAENSENEENESTTPEQISRKWERRMHEKQREVTVMELQLVDCPQVLRSPEISASE